MGNERRCLAAVDIGTSACKTAVFDEEGMLLASAAVEYSVFHPQAGWAEQEPEDWWAAACRGLRECLRQSGIPPTYITGVGLDGQSWACIPMDGGGNALARTPIWMDTRAEELCRPIRAQWGEELFRVSGNPFQPSYTTPKIMWFRKNRPELTEKTVCYLQSNSFLAYRLTGVLSQDFSQGYGLHVFDIRNKRYDTSLCQKLGIVPDTLPPLYACDSIVGYVTNDAARQTGLAAGTPVVAGGLDAACGTLGAGVYRPGQTQEQGGQAGGMSICLNRPAAHEALILSTHVVPGLWLLQGGTMGGGGSLRWLARELGQPELFQERASGKRQLELLDDLAATVPPGAEGTIFLPYLSGERSPVWDTQASGVFFGLSYEKSRAHLFRALLEGVAYALRHNLDTARELGVEVDSLYSMGGAANSRLWTQIKSDVTGLTIHVPDSDAATVRGAALLAGVGTGVYRSYEDAVERTVCILREHRPNPQAMEAYTPYYGIYRKLYPALRPLMWENAEIRRNNSNNEKRKVCP